MKNMKFKVETNKLGESNLDESDRDSLTKIKYRTLSSKEVIADCVCENVVVSGDAYNGFELEVVSE